MTLLKEFVSNMREIYRTVPEGVIISDSKGKIAFINKSALSITGTSEKKWNQKPVSSFFIDKISKGDLEELNTSKVLYKITSIRSAKGKKINLRVLLLLLESENDTPGYVYIFRLNSDDDQEEIYSEKNNSFLQVLSSRQGQAFFISNVQKSRTLFCSKSIEKICGWSSGEFTEGGWAFSCLMIHPLDRQRVLKLMLEEIENRNNESIIHDHVPVEILYRFKTKKNNWIWIDSKTSVLERDSQGQVKYMIGCLTRYYPSPEEVRKLAISMLEEDIFIKDGRTYVNLDTLIRIQKSLIQQSTDDTTYRIDSIQLSNRETEILSHILDGLNTNEISKIIHVSPNTVNMHRKQIMKKMNAKNLVDLVRKSLERGIFQEKK